MKITVIGCGYVGLSTGVALACVGHHVTFVDVDEQSRKFKVYEQVRLPFLNLALVNYLKQQMIIVSSLRVMVRLYMNLK